MVLLASGCGRRSSGPINAAPRVDSAAGLQVIDSSRAVLLAREALLRSRGFDTMSMRVGRFERRADTFLIQLLPVLPPADSVGIAIIGGGLVAVSKSGTVSVLEHYR
jgi:hypothetical protein